jgi:hypothetical protein
VKATIIILVVQWINHLNISRLTVNAKAKRTCCTTTAEYGATAFPFIRQALSNGNGLKVCWYRAVSAWSLCPPEDSCVGWSQYWQSAGRRSCARRRGQTILWLVRPTVLSGPSVQLLGTVSILIEIYVVQGLHVCSKTALKSISARKALELKSKSKSKSKSEVTLQLTVSQSVCQGIEPILGLVTRYCFLSEGCFLKFAVLSL